MAAHRSEVVIERSSGAGTSRRLVQLELVRSAAAVAPAGRTQPRSSGSSATGTRARCELRAEPPAIALERLDADARAALLDLDARGQVHLTQSSLWVWLGRLVRRDDELVELVSKATATCRGWRRETRTKARSADQFSACASSRSRGERR